MKALIIQNSRGGYSILPPGSHQVGNYPTPGEASNIAVQNGWTPQLDGLTESQRKRLVPVLNHAEVEGPLHNPHFERGVKILRKIVRI